MKQFLAFVKKEFYHIFRDKRTMLILLGMPIVQILLFGFAISTEVKNTKIVVYDPSNDINTKNIIQRVDASPYFTVVERINHNDIDEIFKQNRGNVILVFEENFGENLIHLGKANVQLINDATDPNQATMISNYLSQIILSYQQELIQEHKVPFVINTELKMLYNPQLKSSYNFVPGVMGMILMLICAMMTSIAIVREKEMGTMEVLLASPIKPIYIIISKVVPYLFLASITLCIILLLSVFVLDVPIKGSLFWIVAASLVFVMVALSLGMLISTLVKTQVSAMLISVLGLMMPTMLMSGMIFPLENMPFFMQKVSTLMPARWYISIVRKLMIQGVEPRFIFRELMVLCLMMFVLLSISLKKFKVRLS